jgi:hypothetical protein
MHGRAPHGWVTVSFGLGGSCAFCCAGRPGLGQQLPTEGCCRVESVAARAREELLRRGRFGGRRLRGCPSGPAGAAAPNQRLQWGGWSRRGVGWLGVSAVYHDSSAVCSCFSPPSPPNKAQGVGMNLGPGVQQPRPDPARTGQLSQPICVCACMGKASCHIVPPQSELPHSSGMSWQTANHG